MLASSQISINFWANTGECRATPLITIFVRARFAAALFARYGLIRPPFRLNSTSLVHNLSGSDDYRLAATSTGCYGILTHWCHELEGRAKLCLKNCIQSQKSQGCD
jgi:hypothetical protein